MKKNKERESSEEKNGRNDSSIKTRKWKGEGEEKGRAGQKN